MKYYDVNTREIFPGGRGERGEGSLFKTWNFEDGSRAPWNPRLKTTLLSSKWIAEELLSKSEEHCQVYFFTGTREGQELNKFESFLSFV